MIEITILKHLESEMKVPVLMERPEEKIEKYVLVEKTGGSEREGICSATVAVQSYAGSLYEAAVLNEEVKEAMRKIIAGNVFSVSLNSDYNFTDTDSKEYRYQAVFDLEY